MEQIIKIVDLFAGPGGLGEGFSSHPAFRISVSAEMESSAHATLRLRAFYRCLKRLGEDALAPYFAICNGEKPPIDNTALPHWDEQTKAAWAEACEEAMQLTLGEAESNAKLDQAIKSNKISSDVPWVLIGGPPCQAYSLVGRARNKGKADYKAEDDHRHFLYKEYLRIIAENKPHVFVMENVKGILSSKIGSQLIFHSILKDLSGCGYQIHSLVTDTCFMQGDNPATLDARKFIVHAEKYGVPQARHRVILLGIREDIGNVKGPGWSPPVLHEKGQVSVIEAINDLPPLRSRISKGEDSPERWKSLLLKHCHDLATQARLKKHSLDCVADVLDNVVTNARFPISLGKIPSEYQPPKYCPEDLSAWYTTQGTTKKLRNILNHEARGHMESDLRRYVYAASFARATGASPKGYKDFALKGLAPDHENWESGKFADRFRVQLEGRPSTTITSHIAKDGHYFIHYDPRQCRSLTVREAARLQTFPDDYFFQGNRTQQYHQVGNAVPSFLASQIADIVYAVLHRPLMD
ncbi:DNA cytosine methyltransferase [Deefgea rivuli]|uniref:DNA cytosine methyltransferase n=1 Tax=Deefgea rivuli TaxID=400948 RepID=UPI0004831EE4|nr:DNA cytosine methyltransferase [Deefgea rivuli]